MRALSDYAARRDQSLSLIAEAAIASFLSPDAAERQEAAVVKRLDQIDGAWRAWSGTGISVETLALFIRFWLTTTPALPEPAQAAARAKGAERYDSFVAALGRRLVRAPNSVRDSGGRRWRVDGTENRSAIAQLAFAGPPFPCHRYPDPTTRDACCVAQDYRPLVSPIGGRATRSVHQGLS